MRKVIGGANIYGPAVGIIMLETKFPRVPGDIGNATTFSFPVLYEVVKGVRGPKVLQGDPTLLNPFIEAGKALCRNGVRTIVTSCGFLALFQRELSLALHVPVYTSSLIQIPLVYGVTGKKVGVLTANSQALTELHFQAVGASGIPVAVEGIEDTYFWNVLLNDLTELDVRLAEDDVIIAAQRLVSKHQDIGAIVLECTNLPPFAKSIQQVVDLPVFDIITLTNMAYEAVARHSYGAVE